MSAPAVVQVVPIVWILVEIPDSPEDQEGLVGDASVEPLSRDVIYPCPTRSRGDCTVASLNIPSTLETRLPVTSYAQVYYWLTLASSSGKQPDIELRE